MSQPVDGPFASDEKIVGTLAINRDLGNDKCGERELRWKDSLSQEAWAEVKRGYRQSVGSFVCVGLKFDGAPNLCAVKLVVVRGDGKRHPFDYPFEAWIQLEVLSGFFLCKRDSALDIGRAKEKYSLLVGSNAIRDSRPNA